MLFFFHPLVWLAEGEWRLAHEMACDEQALLRTGASQAGYGGMLLEVMGQLQRAVPAGLLAAGVVDSYARVRRRLVAIRQIRAISRRGWALVSLLLAAAGTAGILPWRLTAAPPRQQPPSGEVRRLEKKRINEKQISAAAILLLPKPVVVSSALFGWEPSPLVRSSKLLAIRLNRSLVRAS